MRQLRLLGACGLAAVVVVLACSGPTTPEEQSTEPAMVLAFDSVSCLPGEKATLSLQMQYTPSGKVRTDSLVGFNIRLGYNHRALSFLGGIKTGHAISQWEYFTYRYRVHHLEGGDTVGTILIVGIRDFDNGRALNPPRQEYPEGTLFEVSFQTTSDWAYLDSTMDLGFLSVECGDNSFYPYSPSPVYYLAGPTSDEGYAGPIVDTSNCFDRIRLEPVVEFRSGAITIREPEFGPDDTLDLWGP